MATPPVFTAGSILEASQLNQIGMWRMTPTVSGSGVSISQGTITATAATSAVVSNCFSADYDFYRMIIRYQTSTNNQLSMRLRVGGTDAITNYNYSQVQAYAGFGVTVARSTAQTSMEVGKDSTGAFWNAATLDILGPALAEPTTFTNHNTRNDGSYAQPSNFLYDGNHSTATAYDSCNLFVASGTFTAKFAIYGYRL
jgi:hypothetical protein